MLKILVVEASVTRAESTARVLRRQGYQARSVDSGAEALRLHKDADLVLLDLDVPDVDGLQICQAIRDDSGTPIIAFTERDTELDRVLALQAGADDCVVKSCGSREVLARIEALVRRVYPWQEGPCSISLHPLHIDGRSREIRVDGRLVDVTAKEFDLLYALATHPEKVISRKELMVKIWERDAAESSRTIDTHVSSLRAKLGDSEWIVTVRGVGYRIGRGRDHARPTEHRQAREGIVRPGRPERPQLGLTARGS
ncbi:response regulator transcription factor [Streptomyces lancefieldiae]|uniref:Response regulator transcription factor n=1 Tax=Streptomyces lancefieldiae TaxID=3075520 RepID=A0ABU3AYW5_9ACTN|nr:response regulator transcription factor [Streptomyces sp. DSM 40712]MDT0615384.1 response regulator transcription factor [Streptomyces sp. DSM 40712]